MKEHLSTSQDEFEKLAQTARNFNDEMGRAKSIRDLSASYDQAKNKINALNDSLSRQEKELQAMKSAYDELIRVSANSTGVVLAQRDGMEDLVKAQVRLKNEISDTNFAIKKQAELYEKGEITYKTYLDTTTKLQVHLNDAKEEQRKLNMQIKDGVKISQAIVGSYDDMDARLNALRRQYRKLGEEQRNNPAIGGQILKDIDELDKELKELDATMGIHNRNVGNYKSALDGLDGVLAGIIPQWGQMTSAIRTATSVFDAVKKGMDAFVNASKTNTAALQANTISTEANTVATKGATTANLALTRGLKLLRLALISTGIGAIVLALAALAVYFMKTTEGSDQLRKVLEPLKQVFGVLTKLSASLGKTMRADFLNPLDAIERFANALKNPIQALKNLRSEAKRVKDGFTEAIAEGRELANIKIQKDNLSYLNPTRIQALKNTEAYFRRIAASEEASNAERRKAIAEQKKALEARLDFQRLELELSLRQARIEAKRNLNEVEGKKAISDAQIALMELDKEREDTLRRIERREKQINNQNKRATGQAAKQGESLAKKRAEWAKSALDAEERLAKEKASAEERTFERIADVNRLIIDNEDETTQKRVEALGRYNEWRLKAIEKNTESEMLQVDKNEREIGKLRAEGRVREAEALKALNDLLIEEIYQAENEKRRELELKTQKELWELTKAGLEDEHKEQIEIIKQDNEEQVAALKDRYARGVISRKEYQDQLLDIQREASILEIDTAIDAIEKIIAARKAAGLDTADAERELSRLRRELAMADADYEIAKIEEVAAKRKEAVEKAKAMAKEATQALAEIANNTFENQKKSIDEERAREDERYEQRKQNIQRNVQDEEERDRQLNALERDRTARQIQLDRKKRQLEINQAKLKKAIDLAGAITSTAKAITEAYPNIPLSIAIGALGALQIAKIASTKIPQFWTGTDYSPEGWATVGEKGHELYVTPKGQVGITPNTTTLAYLERGTKILNAEKTRRVIAGEMIPEMKQAGWGALIASNNRMSNEVARAIGNIKQEKTIFRWDERGVTKWVRKTGGIEKWRNKYIR